MSSFSWNLIALIVSLYVRPDDLGIKNTGSELFHFFFLTNNICSCKWIYERSYIRNAEKDMETSMIYAVVHTTYCKHLYLNHSFEYNCDDHWCLSIYYYPYFLKINLISILDADLKLFAGDVQTRQMCEKHCY